MKIIFRGDSGFCRKKMLRWCDHHGVDYIIGLAKNKRLKAMGSDLMEQAEARFNETGKKQRLFGEFRYAAGTWDRERRVIIKAEHGSMGCNPRFIVTSLEGDPQELYDEVYCARGDMENRIKEQQLDLYADRTSAHKWWANQFRLLLSSLAYMLFDHIRRTALKNTRLARATSATIRNKLIRIGAVVLRNTRRVRLHLSSAYPHHAPAPNLRPRIGEFKVEPASPCSVFRRPTSRPSMMPSRSGARPQRGGPEGRGRSAATASLAIMF